MIARAVISGLIPRPPVVIAGADPQSRCPDSVLRLYRDGAPVGTLRLGPDRAWFTPDTHAAALPAATLDRLQRELDAGAP